MGKSIVYVIHIYKTPKKQPIFALRRFWSYALIHLQHFAHLFPLISDECLVPSSDVDYRSSVIRIRSAPIPALDTNSSVSRAGQGIEDDPDNADDERAPECRAEVFHIKVRSQNVSNKIQQQCVDD